MKQTNKSLYGTSFHGVTIETSVSNLRKVLGKPQSENNDGEDKVNFDWFMENEDGEVFTVYDWKEYRPLDEDEIIEWHIGGSSKYITLKAKEEIEEAISKI